MQKHALALHAMHADGSVDDALPPYGHYDRAGLKRYRSSFE